RSMKINENVRLEGRRCILVPYTRKMVDTYHSWMANSEELREETESELLTPEEEYEMQTAWYEDVDKIIFIVLDKSRKADPSLGEIAAGMSSLKKGTAEKRYITDSF
ncbi:conserved hypothetical protein, partial [Perkinsus marinus ATCC 50983]